MIRSGFKPKLLITEPKKRTKKCSQCRTVYEPRSAWQKVCGAECGAAYAKAERERKEKKERQTRLIELKPAKWWKAKAKKAMHLFVRTRDEGQPCASCDTLLLKLGRCEWSRQIDVPVASYVGLVLSGRKSHGCIV